MSGAGKVSRRRDSCVRTAGASDCGRAHARPATGFRRVGGSDVGGEKPVEPTLGILIEFENDARFIVGDVDHASGEFALEVEERTPECHALAEPGRDRGFEASPARRDVSNPAAPPAALDEEPGFEAPLVAIVTALPGQGLDM